MDNDADARIILMAPPPYNWKMQSIVMRMSVCLSVSLSVREDIPRTMRDLY